jgi:hypothetical protein
MHVRSAPRRVRCRDIREVSTTMRPTTVDRTSAGSPPDTSAGSDTTAGSSRDLSKFARSDGDMDTLLTARSTIAFAAGLFARAGTSAPLPSRRHQAAVDSCETAAAGRRQTHDPRSPAATNLLRATPPGKRGDST